MKLTNEFSPIRVWALNKGIYDHGDSKTQLIKLQEEVGELAKAILKNDTKEIEDAIGDCVIVLTSLAKLSNVMPIETCINDAYEQIKKRTGVMHNGTFVKNEK